VRQGGSLPARHHRPTATGSANRYRPIVDVRVLTSCSPVASRASCLPRPRSLAAAGPADAQSPDRRAMEAAAKRACEGRGHLRLSATRRQCARALERRVRGTVRARRTACGSHTPFFIDAAGQPCRWRPDGRPSCCTVNLGHAIELCRRCCRELVRRGRGTGGETWRLDAQAAQRGARLLATRAGLTRFTGAGPDGDARHRRDADVVEPGPIDTEIVRSVLTRTAGPFANRRARWGMARGASRQVWAAISPNRRRPRPGGAVPGARPGSAGGNPAQRIAGAAYRRADPVVTPSGGTARMAHAATQRRAGVPARHSRSARRPVPGCAAMSDSRIRSSAC